MNRGKLRFAVLHLIADIPVLLAVVIAIGLIARYDPNRLEDLTALIGLIAGGFISEEIVRHMEKRDTERRAR